MQDRVAVQIRHDEIKQHKVDSMGVRSREQSHGLFAALSDNNAIAKTRDNPLQQNTVNRIIVDKKKSTKHSNRPTGTDRPESTVVSPGLVKAPLTDHQNVGFFWFKIDRNRKAPNIELGQ